MTKDLPPKDPDAIEPYFIVWCDEDGTNDGTANDSGELQGATIGTSGWTGDSAAGLTEDSEDTAAVTIAGIAYDVNTVATIWLSGGTDGVDYDLLNTVDFDDGRTLEKTITVMVRSQ